MSRLLPPDNGVAVRMYRIGHGDCFLLAMPRQGGGEPVYVLIDCGYKPGSPNFVHNKSIGDIVEHIGQATGKRIDLFIITHEHQDHVNGIWKKINPHFGDFDIQEAWLAWTEDPADALANQLRQDHRDQLLGLVEARRQLALAVGEDAPAIHRLDSLLSLEFGGESDAFDLASMRFAASDPAASVNKQCMKLVKDKAGARRGVRYLSPGGAPRAVTGAAGVRAFVLGPPRDETLLVDEDPKGGEAFPGGAGGHGLSFWAAAGGQPGAAGALFDRRYQVPRDEALAQDFFMQFYGREGDGLAVGGGTESPSNAAWRRIDAEWLFAAESLALKLNRGINNTSLVLAFELPASRKVLLFSADAQRGNWISWDDHNWQDGERTITARDLLARTVLYKAGHHGSHNATLDGRPDDDYPNLAWMGRGAYAGEFTAMITAVNEWALTKNNPPWRHPLPSIRQALEHKTQGRVFQTDIAAPVPTESAQPADWAAFMARTHLDELYFDYIVTDDPPGAPPAAPAESSARAAGPPGKRTRARRARPHTDEPI